MTSTYSRLADVETETVNYIPPAPLIRPYVTAERPTYRPADVDELVRRVTDETLTLPAAVEPVALIPLRAPTPVVYDARHATPPERPDDYLGRRRRPMPGWTMLLIGAGVILIAEAMSALTLIAVFS